MEGLFRLARLKLPGNQVSATMRFAHNVMARWNTQAHTDKAISKSRSHGHSMLTSIFLGRFKWLTQLRKMLKACSSLTAK